MLKRVPAPSNVLPDRSTSRLPLVLAALVSLSTAACGSSTTGVLPTRAGRLPSPALTLVWVGHGEAERMEAGSWKRVEPFDYEFTVEQRRYADHWESVKHLKRLHPDYDGSAGPREQTLYFRVDLDKTDSEGQVAVHIRSSLGQGEGRADRSFRTASLAMHADVSRFAPFDTYRIAQSYQYESGELVETVSLDKGSAPWVRNRESATLFAPHRFETPPTTR